MLKRAGILIQLLCAGMMSLAQQNDAARELQKIRTYYNGPEMKHVSGQMLLVNKADNQQLDKVNFEYWIQDKKLFTRMSHIEVLNNDSVYVMVNHRNKTIYVRPSAAVTAATPTGFFDANQLGKLLNAKGITTTLLQEGADNKLTISGIQDSRFSSIIIKYANGDNKIKEVLAVVKPSGDKINQQLQLQVTYNLTEKSMQGSCGGCFSAGRYIKTGKDGSLEYTQIYKGYKKL